MWSNQSLPNIWMIHSRPRSVGNRESTTYSGKIQLLPLNSTFTSALQSILSQLKLATRNFWEHGTIWQSVSPSLAKSDLLIQLKDEPVSNSIFKILSLILTLRNGF